MADKRLVAIDDAELHSLAAQVVDDRLADSSATADDDVVLQAIQVLFHPSSPEYRDEFSLQQDLPEACERVDRRAETRDNHETPEQPPPSESSWTSWKPTVPVTTQKNNNTTPSPIPIEGPPQPISGVVLLLIGLVRHVDRACVVTDRGFPAVCYGIPRLLTDAASKYA